MSALTDGEIVKGCLDPKNWGCAVTIIVGALAVVAAALTVAGTMAMGAA